MHYFISILLCSGILAGRVGAVQKRGVLYLREDDVLSVVNENYIQQGKSKPLALFKFENTIPENGWSQLEIETNGAKSDIMQAYGAGYLEGHQTKNLIELHWNNTILGYCSTPSKYCKKLYNFLDKNLKWMKMNIQAHPTNQYWNHVRLVLLQLQGLEDGYRDLEKADLTIRLQPFGFLLFQIGGDLEALESAFGKKDLNHPIGSGSCSALIKLLSGNKDLFVSQDTWSNYQSMLRIMKKYTLNFSSRKHTAAFSGYPGSIFSGDDFYILSSKLVTLETTNGNNNPDLWKFLSTETVLEWIRNIIANRLADNGKEWSEIFKQHNSGTYNNQWMIVDYKKFKSGMDALQEGLLYILEQIPGKIVYSDETRTLEKYGYWASYNVPYFPEIFNMSGNVALVKQFGDWFTHEKNPRAKMFQRDHSKVEDIKSLIKLMRYNDFKHDEISRCNCTPPYSAENTIAARSDLNAAEGKYPFSALQQRNHGATDVKLTSSHLVESFGIVAECGPTHDTQPVFKWSTSPYANIPHAGHPDVFDFKPVFFNWN